jgi:hypothetical protein
VNPDNAGSRFCAGYVLGSRGPAGSFVTQASGNFTSPSISRGKRRAEPTGLEPSRDHSAPCDSLRQDAAIYWLIFPLPILGFSQIIAHFRKSTALRCLTGRLMAIN